MATRGYSGYKGRKSPWKIVAAILLVLVILAAAGVLVLQRYLVYDASGTPHLRLPGQEEIRTPASSGDASSSGDIGPVDVTIDLPERQSVLGYLLTAPNADLTPYLAPDGDLNAVAVTLKGADGQLRTGWQDDETLRSILADESRHTVARISCFLDGANARSQVKEMGLENTGGYIFYDATNRNWLDPGKPAAREFLLDLIRQAAEAGFDEILLTEVFYPTEGKLDKIAYTASDRTESLTLFLTEAKGLLADYPGVTLSVAVTDTLLLDGEDETSGQSLSGFAALADAIYALCEGGDYADAKAAVSAAANGKSTAFVALFDGVGYPPEEYLIPEA